MSDTASDPATAGDHNSDLFFTAIQTTRTPMLVIDPRQPGNPIVFANRAFYSMAGYTEAEIVGQNCRFLQGPETDRATVAEIREAIAAVREVTFEILNYRKDGSTFWNALFISPVFTRGGKLVYFFASQLDASRRRDTAVALARAQKMEALGQLTGGIAYDSSEGPAGSSPGLLRPVPAARHDGHKFCAAVGYLVQPARSPALT